MLIFGRAEGEGGGTQGGVILGRGGGGGGGAEMDGSKICYLHAECRCPIFRRCAYEVGSKLYVDLFSG